MTLSERYLKKLEAYKASPSLARERKKKKEVNLKWSKMALKQRLINLRKNQQCLMCDNPVPHFKRTYCDKCLPKGRARMISLGHRLNKKVAMPISRVSTLGLSVDTRVVGLIHNADSW